MLPAAAWPLPMLRKSTGHSKLGGPFDTLEGRLEKWASRNRRSITHMEGIEKMGPGSSQGAWREEINRHKNRNEGSSDRV